VDAEEYRRASAAAWEEAAPGWERVADRLEAAMAPVTARLVDRLELHPGDTVLELATGPGVTGVAAARAVAPGGRAIVSDRAPAMVDAARRRAAAAGVANVEARVLDIERIDLPDAHVDAVVCRLGCMLVPDPAAAFREIGRVLRPGGRFAVAVWAERARNPWAAVTWDVVTERGLVPAPDPEAPGMFALADAGRLRGVAAEAGLDLALEEVPLSFRYDGFDDYWGTMRSVSTTLRRTVEELGDEEERQLAGALRERLEPYAVAGGYEVPGVAIVAAGAADTDVGPPPAPLER
jgi:SAM-dependent methyltransferase